MSGDRPTLPPRSEPTGRQPRDFLFPMFWFAKDAARIVAAAKEIVAQVAPGRHFADNFLTWGRNMSMLDDQAFVQAWESNIESGADRAIMWRRYVLACSGYHCVQLDGDFVECGAYTGVGVKTVVDYLGGTSFPKTFWAYDAFEHNDSMAHHSMPDHGPDLHQRVSAKFADYPQVKIVKGLIPDSFQNNAPERIAYMHIDLNQAPAEIAALDHLFDRMTPGGMLILDDYEWAAAIAIRSWPKIRGSISAATELCRCPQGRGF